MIVGSAASGRALATSHLLADAGVTLVGVFGFPDGGDAHALSHTLTETIADHGVTVGVIATVPGHAQQACEALCAAGVELVVNFADAHVDPPASVPVHSMRPVARLLLALAVGARRAGPLQT